MLCSQAMTELLAAGLRTLSSWLWPCGRTVTSSTTLRAAFVFSAILYIRVLFAANDEIMSHWNDNALETMLVLTCTIGESPRNGQRLPYKTTTFYNYYIFQYNKLFFFAILKHLLEHQNQVRSFLDDV